MGLVRAVIRSFDHKIAPLRLAESWDNVGLLLESPKLRSNGASKVMLTIDLTPAVVEEALANDTGVIVAYHPPIFSGLKSLTLTNPLQRSLLRCAAEGISIFSPHTALDSVRDGVNDTLAASLGDLAESNLIGEEKENGAGAGRIVTLSQPVSLENLCERVKAYCGLKHLQVGVPAGPDSKRLIRTVAICAGSGGSLLKGVQAHAYLTGEMSHHEVLAAVAQGTSVILCGHSNTERPYLPTLQKKLQQALDDDGELEGESYEVVIRFATMAPVPKTMKAARVNKQGGIEELEVVEIPVPTPKPGEIVIKTEWAGVNFIDTYFRGGVYPRETPFTLGQEAAGTIAVLPSSDDVLNSSDYKLASQFGATVIGTTSSQAKAEIAKKAGAAHIINYTEASVPEKVLKLTNGRGVEAIFDGVGASTWDGNFTSIRRKGTIVSFGNASGVVPPFSVLKLGPKNVKICRPVVNNYLIEPAEFHEYTTELFDIIKNGKLGCAIHGEYPFTTEGMRQTHTDITGRGTSGKLVVKIA
ncbi:unnamed protein product [Rhizoctonia solani]|uniref:Enoyl reductase (ER) domain-containing protein n=1 Tax=Rhizoctonia solani TaxID=456999 RepID=A0A8H3H7A2_9AGAM|nr:unnamed protein product [Rhizoctonia solani]